MRVHGLLFVYLLYRTFASMLYGYWHFPLHNGIWPMLAAMFLLVLASQSFRRYHDEYSTIVKNRVEYSRIIRNHFYFDYRIFIPRACHVSAISVIVEYIPATTLFPDIRRSSVERHTIILQPNALSVFVPFCHSFFTVIETTQNRFAKSSICSLAISRIKKY